MTADNNYSEISYFVFDSYMESLLTISSFISNMCQL